MKINLKDAPWPSSHGVAGKKGLLASRRSAHLLHQAEKKEGTVRCSLQTQELV